MNVRVNHPTNRPNLTEVRLGGVTLTFSYETCIAVSGPTTNYRTIGQENVWGPTTGRHLNHARCAERLSADAFALVLAEALGAVTVGA